MTSIPVLKSVSEINEQYAAWFCDIWGVMHNGVNAFVEASQACERFIQKGGAVILISNAPRPAYSVEEQFEYLGVPKTAYNSIVTSGDVTRALIRKYAHMPLFHLGPERDQPVLDGIDVQLVGQNQAEVILCTGLFDDDQETPDDYRTMLTIFAERDVPFICANPDLKVERGDRLLYCAGALAQMYQEMGGQVLYAGKPYAPIYEEAQVRLQKLTNQSIPKSRILCIGDGLYTDMLGAEREGFDALFIASGLHVDKTANELPQDVLEALFADKTYKPIAAQVQLQW